MKRILSLIGGWFSGPPLPPPDGPFERYYDNGHLEVKGTLKDGEWDGPIMRFYDDGQLRMMGMIKDGEPCGEWIHEGVEIFTYDPC